MDPRLHVARQPPPHQHVSEETETHAVEKRRDLHQSVVVDGDENHHQDDADERPDDLPAVERSVGAEVRRAVHQRAADRRNDQRGGEQIDVDTGEGALNRHGLFDNPTTIIAPAVPGCRRTCR